MVRIPHGDAADVNAGADEATFLKSRSCNQRVSRRPLPQPNEKTRLLSRRDRNPASRIQIQFLETTRKILKASRRHPYAGTSRHPIWLANCGPWSGPFFGWPMQRRPRQPPPIWARSSIKHVAVRRNRLTRMKAVRKATPIEPFFFLRTAEMLYPFVLSAFMRRRMFPSGCKML